MANCDKYLLYRQRRRRAGSTDEWEFVTPAVYSVNGDGTQPLYIMASTDDINCCPNSGGGGGDTPSAGDTEWRVVSGEYNCSGTTKVQRLQLYQYNGSQWVAMQQFRDGNVIEEESVDCGYVPTPDTPYAEQYFTIVPTSGGYIRWSGNTDISSNNTLSYSTNSGASWSSYSSYQNISVSAGNKIMFKGQLVGGSVQGNYYGAGTFSGSTATFNVEGNSMSLIYDSNFTGQTALDGKSSVFMYLLSGTKVVDASNFVLPATYVTTHAYDGMFNNCTGLTLVPTLPATELTTCSYDGMFRGCTSLVVPPSLPATSLASFCYENMFNGCTSLTTAPALPATTLAVYCYSGMFNGCTNLASAPTLPSTSMQEHCYERMFQGCTRLTTAPRLAATTIADYAYRYMFYGCTSLNSVTCLATTFDGSNCTYQWLYNVASTGTFTKASSITGWTTGTSGIPSGWTTQNA